MAKNLITQNPYTVTGIKPGQWFLDSSEDFSTLTSPGYLSSVASAGIDFQPNDFVFAQYNDGANVGMFNVIESDPGVFSLTVYSPNSNSFIFNNVQFVAKGGSDLNPGTSMGLPKLTIGAAITALGLTPSNTGVVWVLDDGEYTENLVLPFNMQLWAPLATINSNAGDTITVNDTGSNTVASISVFSLNCNDPASKVINLLGSQSNIFLCAKIVYGDMYIEGGMVDCNVAQVVSEVHVASTGQFGANIFNGILFSITADPGATIVGDVGQIGGGNASVSTYGQRTFVDKLIFQTDPIDETAGRTIELTDASSRIVYNNAANGNFELPATADVALPIGTNIEFTQLGLGVINFVAGAGVTIVSQFGPVVSTTGTGSSAKAWKYTDTIWILSGNVID